MHGPLILRQIKVNLQSAVGAAVNGEPVRIAGNNFEVQTLGPAALFEIQGSSDLSNWVVLTNYIGNTPLTALGSGLFMVNEGPPWVRVVILADVGGPRNFEAVLNIGKVKG